MGINIALDGHAGSGKGTISKLLAKKLGFYCLDTGAIYRSIALFMINKKIDPNCEKEVVENLKNVSFKVEFEKDENGNQIQKNILHGKDLKNEIRKEKIGEGASIISQYYEVRNFADDIQHEVANKYDVVVEGRDIGTAVLPNAEFKFFLTAAPEIRARRRLLQLNLPESQFETVLADIKERDFRDQNREINPLKKAEDAILIDNGNLTIEETLLKMLEVISVK